MYDHVLKGGRVIDPKRGIDRVLDIAIEKGRIAEVSERIEKEAKKTLDVTGSLVTPGLIDAHVHCYHSTGMHYVWAGDYSLQPDYFNFSSGVTSLVDVGSSGSYNFRDFKASVIDHAKTRIFALLNICDHGMSSIQIEQFPEKNDPDSFVRCAQEFPEIIKGIKIAHYWGKDWADVEYAKKVQERLETPIMVDFGFFKKERPYDELLLHRLDAGDITTHCFTRAAPILDERGNVYDFLYSARDRGIRFDLGHGFGSFLLRKAVPAMRQGFIPDTFSTDLHGLSINASAISMQNLLSKLLACCDIPLLELFRRVTVEPAGMLGLGDIASLEAGTEADIAVWGLREGRFGFQDTAGGSLSGTRKLECEMTFRAGEVVWDLNARAAVPYERLPPLYGLDPESEDLIVPTLK